MLQYGLFIGISTIDLIYEFDYYPQSDTKNNAESVLMYAGGPAYNASVLFSALGGRSKLISAVGKNPLCNVIYEDLGEQGVEFVDLAPDSKEIPTFASIVSTTANAHRTVFSRKSPLNDSQLEPSSYQKLVENADFLLMDGHHMPAALVLAEMADRKGIPVILDAGSWKPGLERLLSFCTDVIASEKFRVPGKDTLAASMHMVRSYENIIRAAATRGPEPVLWWSGDDEGMVDVPEVDAIDTLGSGDFFHGAYAYARYNELGFVESLKYAAEVAAKSTIMMGTRNWLSGMESYKLK
jgi:sugar/nucleoside kinase (ribokinase family)